MQQELLSGEKHFPPKESGSSLIPGKDQALRKGEVEMLEEIWTWR